MSSKNVRHMQSEKRCRHWQKHDRACWPPSLEQEAQAAIELQPRNEYGDETRKSVREVQSNAEVGAQLITPDRLFEPDNHEQDADAIIKDFHDAPTPTAESPSSPARHSP